MLKKPWLATLALMSLVVLFIVLGNRLQLYKDYQHTMERTEMIREFAFNHEIKRYDQQPFLNHSPSYDEHLFFSLNDNYSIFYEGEDGVEYGLGPNYQFGPDAKAIGIFKIGAPVDEQFATKSLEIRL